MSVFAPAVTKLPSASCTVRHSPAWVSIVLLEMTNLAIRPTSTRQHAATANRTLCESNRRRGDSAASSEAGAGSSAGSGTGCICMSSMTFDSAASSGASVGTLARLTRPYSWHSRMNSAMWLGDCLSQRTNLRRSAIDRSRSLRRMNHSAAWSLIICTRASSRSFISMSPVLHVAEVVLPELHAQLAVCAREIAQDHSVGQSLALCDLLVSQAL